MTAGTRRRPLNDADATLLRELLTDRRLLSLAVVDKGAPVIGMVPFVIEPDYSALLVHVSSLALHGRVLAAGAAFAVLIHGLDAPEVAPGEVPRVRFAGTARTLCLRWNTRRKLKAGRA